MKPSFKISDLKNSPVAGLNQHLFAEPVKKQRKYNNEIVEFEGKIFHSIKERDRYISLRFLLRSRQIKDLECQVKFLLVDPNEIELKCEYVADFTYFDINMNKMIVEDVKSKATRKIPLYILKRKLMLSIYGIEIREI